MAGGTMDLATRHYHVLRQKSLCGWALVEECVAGAVWWVLSLQWRDGGAAWRKVDEGRRDGKTA
ncbi:hypothetical protein E2C01_027671 [Portunus trituberculatus]|uniref:Uncharacterized protein n=1 Tax=Portunus trituberculatus TaxID=210409 RepID=A0A5B7ELY1_PORTR|nr:hypothetical protein [Portunus trituberculatus]